MGGEEERRVILPLRFFSSIYKGSGTQNTFVYSVMARYKSISSLLLLEINLSHSKITRNGREISLTAKEYNIFCLLAANKKTCTDLRLNLWKIWGYFYSDGERINKPAPNPIHRTSFWRENKAPADFRCLCVSAFCFADWQLNNLFVENINIRGISLLRWPLFGKYAKQRSWKAGQERRYKAAGIINIAD